MQNLSVNMWNFPVFPFACLNLACINGENNSTECIDFEVFEQFLEHNKCHIHVQFSSVSQSCLTLCNPMDCSTPDLPVHHQFPEFTQTHVHWVSDAIQSSHPLSSPSTPIFNVSHHQGFCRWVSSSHQVAKVLEFQLQHQYFRWIFRTGLC